MSMLGAQLEDLSGLSAQITKTQGDIGTSQSNSLAATNNVVESVRTAAQAALTQITGELSALRASVDAAQGSADGAVWTGANSELFRGAYRDFNSAMAQAEAATNETFSEFNTAIDQMSASLSDYVNQFSASLTAAQESTGSMSTAVEGQRANLDATMNTGMSLG